jgi:hypothetical protein
MILQEAKKTADLEPAFPYEIRSAIVGVFLCVYYAFAVPYASSFMILTDVADRVFWPWAVCDSVFSLAFIYETVWQYRAEGYFYFESSLHKSAARPDFKRNNFAVDVLTVLPFEVLLGFGVPWLDDVVCLVRLNRLFCLCRVPRYSGCLNDFYEHLVHLSSAQSRIVRLFLLVIVLFHWFACGWHVVRFWGNAKTNGYFLSLYWSITTLSTVGYGDIVPATLSQTVYAFVVMVIGDVICATVVSSVTSLMLSIDASSGDFTRRLSLAKGFVQAHQVPVSLQEDIDVYFEHMWSKFRGVEEATIHGMLPKSVRSSVVESWSSS